MSSETTREKQEDAWVEEILGILWVFQTKLRILVAYTGEVLFLSYKLLQGRVVSINHTSQIRKWAIFKKTSIFIQIVIQKQE